MTDLSETIIAKSDQLNADDLIGHPITITITDVKKVAGDQPISINYEGDKGKPYKPCKSMRRLLVHVWGTDGKSFIGRKLSLFNDQSVKWAGENVGGIRISHMSDIEKPVTVALAVTRGKKKAFTVKPLAEETPHLKVINKLKSIGKTFEDFSKKTEEVIGRPESDISKCDDKECEIILDYLSSLGGKK